MKFITPLKPIMLLMACCFVISSCADLSIENKNDPNRERALGEASDIVKLLQGSTGDVFFAITDQPGVHMNGLADQMTATNAFNSFWDFAQEPRLRINNRTTYPDAFIMSDPWSDFNAGVSSANEIIRTIEIDGESIILNDGTDVTQKLLAGAYFLRGISRGYLGLIYDQAYIVDPEFDPTTDEVPEPQPYGAMIDAGVADIDQALGIANSIGESFTWDFLPTEDTWSLSEFKVISNSMAARILAGRARTASEAQNMDWLQVLSYAQKGLGGPEAADGGALKDFTATSEGPFIYYNNLADWTGLIVAGDVDDGAGYLPTDIKVIKMLDSSQPTEYPAAPTVMDPASSNDPRIGYFKYTTNFGFLSASRNRGLFTNYWNLRMFANNNWGQSGYPIVYMTESEIEYIRAEAQLMGGNRAMAATILNESPFGTGETEFSINLPSVQIGLISEEDQSMAGGNQISPTASTAAFQRALLREYSVELDLIAGIGTQWYFMRRHDLLQEGTPLHFAIPGQELEITQSDYYTFGGADNTTGDGTATGENSWRNLDASSLRQVKGRAAGQSSGAYGPVMTVEKDLSTPASTGGDYKGKN